MNDVAGYSPEDEVDQIVENARFLFGCEECPGTINIYTDWITDCFPPIYECKGCGHPHSRCDLI